MQYRLSSL